MNQDIVSIIAKFTDVEDFRILYQVSKAWHTSIVTSIHSRIEKRIPKRIQCTIASGCHLMTYPAFIIAMVAAGAAAYSFSYVAPAFTLSAAKYFNNESITAWTIPEICMLKQYQKEETLTASIIQTVHHRLHDVDAAVAPQHAIRAMIDKKQDLQLVLKYPVIFKCIQEHASEYLSKSRRNIIALAQFLPCTNELVRAYCSAPKSNADHPYDAELCTELVKRKQNLSASTSSLLKQSISSKSLKMVANIIYALPCNATDMYKQMSKQKKQLDKHHFSGKRK